MDGLYGWMVSVVLVVPVVFESLVGLNTQSRDSSFCPRLWCGCWSARAQLVMS